MIYFSLVCGFALISHEASVSTAADQLRLLLYFSQTQLHPVAAERSKDGTMLTVSSAERSATADFVALMEGSLGKELQIRSNYSSAPTFHSDWISAATFKQASLSFNPPSSLWWFYLTLFIYELSTRCFCSVSFCLLISFGPLLQIVFTLGTTTISAPHFSFYITSPTVIFLLYHSPQEQIEIAKRGSAASSLCVYV